MDEASEARVTLKRRFADFLERDFQMPGHDHWSYATALAELYEREQGDDGKAFRLKSRRVTIHEYHLREFDEGLLQRLLEHPNEVLPALQVRWRGWWGAAQELGGAICVGTRGGARWVGQGATQGWVQEGGRGLRRGGSACC